MKEFDYDGDSMVNGAVLKSFLAAFGPYVKRGEQVLIKKFGISELKGGETDFYPLTLFLNAMDEFQKQMGRDFMRKIGREIYSNAVFPPDIDTMAKGMAMVNQAYYMNHETTPGEIGGYNWTLSSDNSGVMVCDNPYPCSFDFGIMEGLAMQLAPEAKIVHDDEKECRHKGGNTCSYTVEW